MTTEELPITDEPIKQKTVLLIAVLSTDMNCSINTTSSLVLLQKNLTKKNIGVEIAFFIDDLTKAKNNFIMSDWILETVLNSGFGKSGNKRRAKKLDDAIQNLTDFLNALETAAAESEPMES